MNYLMPCKELIQTLERLKKEIEWEHSLEYQIALNEVIKMLKESSKDGLWT